MSVVHGQRHGGEIHNNKDSDERENIIYDPEIHLPGAQVKNHTTTN